jgi:Ca-activated chloride channel family protein
VVGLGMQLGVNFANDYSDFVRGADSPRRIGPLRAAASGVVDPKHVRRAALAAFGVAGLAGLALSVAALARPQWGEVTSESKGRGRDVLILVDVSKSMLANDLPPSRLQRAKLAAEDLVRQLGGDRIGVIAFAGTAFLQAPITADHTAVLTAIQELDPEIIPQPGTNICAALQCADEAFDRTEGGQHTNHDCW